MAYIGTKPANQITDSTLIADGTITTADLANGAVTRAKMGYAGAVLQVVQTVKTDVFSTTSTSWTDWTGMSATITPTSSSSRILVTLTSGVSNSANESFQYVKLQRNGSDIALGDSSGSVTRCWIDAALGGGGTSSSFHFTTQKPLAGTFLDSPNTTSAVTYKIQVIRTLNGTAFFGRTSDTADANRSAIPSVLTLMEIAG